MLIAASRALPVCVRRSTSRLGCRRNGLGLGHKCGCGLWLLLFSVCGLSFFHPQPLCRFSLRGMVWCQVLLLSTVIPYPPPPSTPSTHPHPSHSLPVPVHFLLNSEPYTVKLDMFFGLAKTEEKKNSSAFRWLRCFEVRSSCY